MAGEITYTSYRSQKSDDLLKFTGGMFGSSGSGGGTTPTENYVKLTGETSQYIEGDIHIDSDLYASTGNFISVVSINTGADGDGYLSLTASDNGCVYIQSGFHPAYGVNDSFLYINYTGGNILLGKNDDATSIYIYSSTLFYNHIYTNDWVGTSQFVSGFAGSGWKLGIPFGETDSELTVDNLYVRKTMNVYELIINQIRATNGSLWVSDAIKIFSVTFISTGYYTCRIDHDNHHIIQPFAVNDLIRCQKWTGRGIKYYTARVFEIDTATGEYFNIQIIEGAGIPEVGDDVVRIGNTTNTNRQGALYLTSNDSGAPYMDILDGVTTASFAGCTKVRLGKLTGITDADFGGALSGYGLYSNNVYLKGKIVIASGSTGYTNISDKPTSLNGINSGEVTGLQLLSKAQANGRMLYRDPMFDISVNGTSVYNLESNGSITRTRTLATSDSPNYARNGYDLVVTYNGNGVSPGYGGFTWNTPSRANAIFVIRIIAKIPIGRTIEFGTNDIGGDPSYQWVTTHAGTGKYQEYIMYVKCGSYGVFDPTNYIYILGGTNTPFSWYVAYATVYDLTLSESALVDAAAKTADWDNINGIPATLGPPPSGGSGLFIDSSHMGYYTAGAWKTYMDNVGNLILGSPETGPGLSWGQAEATLIVRGTIIAGSGSIAGWTINSNYLGKDTGVASTSCGMSPIDYPFYAGAEYVNRASAPFRVSNSGSVTVQTNAAGKRIVISSANNNFAFYNSAGNQTAVIDNDTSDYATFKMSYASDSNYVKIQPFTIDIRNTSYSPARRFTVIPGSDLTIYMYGLPVLYTTAGYYPIYQDSNGQLFRGPID